MQTMVTEHEAQHEDQVKLQAKTDFRHPRRPPPPPPSRHNKTDPCSVLAADARSSAEMQKQKKVFKHIQTCKM